MANWSPKWAGKKKEKKEKFPIHTSIHPSIDMHSSIHPSLMVQLMAC
jgi:hypothetical protein